MYTEEDIITKCKCIIDRGEVGNLYAQAFINYRSRTKDTHQLCSEVVSKFLLENLDSLHSINIVVRERNYRVPEHLNRSIPTGSNRKEEAIAIGLLRDSIDHGSIYPFGKVFDYQIPLNATKHDHNGKIDIVSESGNEIFLLELKKPDSNETMLRCVLESYTYSKQLDKEKFLEEYGKAPDTKIVPAPLVFKNSRQHIDFESAEQPFLKELINKLAVRVFTI